MRAHSNEASASLRMIGWCFDSSFRQISLSEGGKDGQILESLDAGRCFSAPYCAHHSYDNSACLFNQCCGSEFCASNLARPIGNGCTEPYSLFVDTILRLKVLVRV
jgi:hypothetical protein